MFLGREVGMQVPRRTGVSLSMAVTAAPIRLAVKQAAVRVSVLTPKSRRRQPLSKLFAHHARVNFKTLATMSQQCNGLMVQSLWRQLFQGRDALLCKKHRPRERRARHTEVQSAR